MSNDQLLTLRDFFSLDFLNLQDKSQGIRIAILSACETGLPGMELPDEVINLPTGLLQAGVGGIVSSLWSVADLSTMIMLTRFYDLWRNDKLEPATALRQAQLWVRDTTSQQKAKYFQETNPDLFQSLILLEPDYFAHPFHWAAFTYVGV
jgi:CHAT domain-containing protein